MFKVVNKYEDDRPVIAFTDVPDIPLMALIQFEFKTLACNNKFCLRVSCDNIVMTCKHCLLTYHQFCVGKSGSDEKCGCDRVREELHWYVTFISNKLCYQGLLKFAILLDNHLFKAKLNFYIVYKY